MTSSHPHPAIADGRPVLSQTQHQQVHLVLPPPTDAEAKAFGTLLQLHSEVVIVLQWHHAELQGPRRQGLRCGQHLRLWSCVSMCV